MFCCIRKFRNNIHFANLISLASNVIILTENNLGSKPLWRYILKFCRDYCRFCKRQKIRINNNCKILSYQFFCGSNFFVITEIYSFSKSAEEQNELFEKLQRKKNKLKEMKFHHSEQILRNTHLENSLRQAQESQNSLVEKVKFQDILLSFYIITIVTLMFCSTEDRFFCTGHFLILLIEWSEERR